MSFSSFIGGVASFLNPANAVGTGVAGLSTGTFSLIEKAIKAAGKVVLKPMFSFLGGLAAVYVAATFDILKTILLWFIDLLSIVFAEITTALGFSNLDPTQWWTALNEEPWGANLIYAMNDLGMVDALGIILIALVIRFIIMIIPFVG